MSKLVKRLGAVAALLLASVPAQAMTAHSVSTHAVSTNAGHRHAHARVVQARVAQTRVAQARVAQARVAVATVHEDVIESYLQPVHAAPVGEVTRVPYGWADFCTRRVEECRVDVLEPVDVVVTPEVETVLAEVNARVNAEIEPVSNLDHWGTLLDHWDYPTDGKGDCKIYALWKRKQLLDRGFPRQALLMTIVRDLEGNGHTILTVKTDRGDYILDNMVGEVRLWDETGYKFVKRQSQSDPNVWVSVGPATMPVTTAVVK